MTNRTDSFDRADTTNAIGAASDGLGSWTQDIGTWGIASNLGYKSASNNAVEFASLESSSSNMEVQATITGAGAALYGGINARVSGSANLLFVEMLVNGASGYLKLYKRVASVNTQIGSTYTGTLANGDVIKLRCDSANLLTAYQNGVSRVSATDSAGSTNTRHGLYVYSAVYRFNDFSITDIAAGGAFIYKPSLIVSQAVKAGVW